MAQYGACHVSLEVHISKIGFYIEKQWNNKLPAAQGVTRFPQSYIWRNSNRVACLIHRICFVVLTMGVSLCASVSGWYDSDYTTFLWILIIYIHLLEWIKMFFGHTSKSCKICCWKLQGDSYVLPLLWRGTSVKVSCPASQTKSQTVDPPSVCCSPYSVTVRLHKVSAVEELRLNGKHRNSVNFCSLNVPLSGVNFQGFENHSIFILFF